MYTTGRIIANFVQKSLEAQQYGNAVKHRADLQTVQNSQWPLNCSSPCIALTLQSSTDMARSTSSAL